MFRKNSIGEKLNEIIVKNNVKDLDGDSFERAVEFAYWRFKNLMDLPYDENKIEKLDGTNSNEAERTENFILYVIEHLEIIKNAPFFKIHYYDNKVLGFINHAFYHMCKEIGLEIEPPDSDF